MDAPVDLDREHFYEARRDLIGSRCVCPRGCEVRIRPLLVPGWIGYVSRDRWTLSRNLGWCTGAVAQWCSDALAVVVKYAHGSLVHAWGRLGCVPVEAFAVCCRVRSEGLCSGLFCMAGVSRSVSADLV